MANNSLAVIESPKVEIITPQPTWEVRETLHDEIEGQPHPNFIEGPSAAISMNDLSTKNIIPTFADNSLTISSPKFIETVRKSAEMVFGMDNVSPAECRVSHPQIGRIPSAAHKKASELLDSEKTIYYQRLAWISHIIGFNTTINGQEISLTIGGTRSYSEDKLYARQNPQHFRLFIGFRCRVCSNLLLTCDGVSENLLCMTEADIFQKAVELFQRFAAVKEQTVAGLEALTQTRLSQEQFCQILGRMRLYQALPVAETKQLPKVLLGDSVINAATREYITNPNFGSQTEDGSISMWQFMNLLNEAAKNSYIDLFAERNANCTDIAIGLSQALKTNSREGWGWFLG